MILFCHGVESVRLAYGDRGAVLRMIAADGGCIGLTAMSADLLRHLRAADGHGQDTRGRMRISVFDAPEVNRLAGLRHDARPRAHWPSAVRDVSSPCQLCRTGRFQR
jgi:hypothetical protein